MCVFNEKNEKKIGFHIVVEVNFSASWKTLEKHVLISSIWARPVTTIMNAYTYSGMHTKKFHFRCGCLNLIKIIIVFFLFFFFSTTFVIFPSRNCFCCSLQFDCFKRWQQNYVRCMCENNFWYNSYICRRTRRSFLTANIPFRLAYFAQNWTFLIVFYCCVCKSEN